MKWRFEFKFDGMEMYEHLCIASYIHAGNLGAYLGTLVITHVPGNYVVLSKIPRNW